MTKQEYERVRQEIKKKYKDKISDLERKNLLLAKQFVELSEENEQLRRELNYFKRKYEDVSQPLKDMMKLFEVLR